MRMRMNEMLLSVFGGQRRWMRAAAIVAAMVFVLGPRASYAQTPPPPAPGAHATHQGGAASNPDQELLKQIAELRAQVARLQALVEQQNPASQKPAPGMGGKPQAGMMMDKMEMMMGMDRAEMAGMAGGGMSAGASTSSGGMMKMDKGEMGMPPAEMMKMDMGGMGGQPAAGAGTAVPKDPTPAMAMSQPASSATSVSALPGVPGASHLYHIGSTGFFLDQPQLKLSTDQQARLNQIKERAMLARATSERRIEQAEQELWALTGAGQPDATKIQPKLQEIEQLRTSQRLAFITAVGEATSVLNPEQRDVILGIKK